jgi:hypothetical protein
VESLSLGGYVRGTVATMLSYFPRLQDVTIVGTILNEEIGQLATPPARLKLLRLVTATARNLEAVLGDVDVESVEVHQVDFVESASLRPLAAMHHLHSLQIDPRDLHAGIVADKDFYLAELKHLKHLDVGKYAGNLQFVIDSPSLVSFVIIAGEDDSRLKPLWTHFPSSEVGEVSGERQHMRRITFSRPPAII